MTEESVCVDVYISVNKIIKICLNVSMQDMPYSAHLLYIQHNYQYYPLAMKLLLFFFRQRK